jgi:DNA-binding winged helix-turn-helix (wHTH) protein
VDGEKVESTQKQNEKAEFYRDEHLSIDFRLQLATLDNQRLCLRRKEYDLLALLVRHSGEMIPRAALLMEIWGYGAGIRTRTLDVHIRRVRKKLGQYANHYIETVFGVGYRFQPFRAPRFQQPITHRLERPEALPNVEYIDSARSMTSCSEMAHRSVEDGRPVA